MESPTQDSQGAIPRYPPMIPNPGPLALLPTMKVCSSLASKELKINQLISICLMGCTARLKQQIPQRWSVGDDLWNPICWRENADKDGRKKQRDNACPSHSSQFRRVGKVWLEAIFNLHYSQ